MESGAVNGCCCQPEEVSLENVTEASSEPVLDQMCPTCVPVSLLVFQKRTPTICPAMSVWKAVPNS
jgi:hypothetical protein